MLEHDVISKLEGLGWVEHKLSNLLYLPSDAKLSIEINGSVDMVYFHLLIIFILKEINIITYIIIL